MLDAELTQKEIQQAVYELNDAKSPGVDGVDGFTAEFYKKIWPLTISLCSVHKLCQSNFL